VNPLKRKLAEDGITLKPGVIVSCFGYVDLYAPRPNRFTVTAIDVEGLLGDVARRVKNSLRACEKRPTRSQQEPAALAVRFVWDS